MVWFILVVNGRYSRHLIQNFMPMPDLFAGQELERGLPKMPPLSEAIALTRLSLSPSALPKMWNWPFCHRFRPVTVPTPIAPSRSSAKLVTSLPANPSLVVQVKPPVLQPAQPETSSNPKRPRSDPPAASGLAGSAVLSAGQRPRSGRRRTGPGRHWSPAKVPVPGLQDLIDGVVRQTTFNLPGANEKRGGVRNLARHGGCAHPVLLIKKRLVARAATQIDLPWLRCPNMSWTGLPTRRGQCNDGVRASVPAGRMLMKRLEKGMLSIP